MPNEVQSKETLTAPWSAAWPLDWWKQIREGALPRGHPSLDWRERPCRGTGTASRPRGQIAGISKLPAWWPETHTGAHDPQHALQKNGGLADQRHMDDGDIMCHPILVLPFLQDIDVANARVGAERNPLNTEVVCYVNDVDAAPPE